ncbi:M56 family metallopeptidase [Ilumatobacter sp.]|uniref:M56 family metallopeptidase n=1 Tax=Ilumatobacter sp. TaxID=1967498 RepID=UPI003AF947BA
MLLASVVVAAVPTLWLIGLSGVAHFGLRNPIIDWSHHLLPDQRPVGAIIGVASLIAAAIGTVRAAGVLLHHRRMRCVEKSPLQIMETDEIYAYTFPGPAGTIAISTGLRGALDSEEFDIVVAHEVAHARHRHDRYKLLALLATAFVPPVRSIASGLDYHIERWADEEAVETTRAERRVVARTIAKVALAGASPAPALGIADNGVAARAAALLAPMERPALTMRLRTGFVLATTVMLALYQLHHNAIFATSLIG